MNALAEPRLPGRGLCLLMSPAALLAYVALSATPPDLVKQGEAHDQKLQAREALTCYLAAEKMTPDDPALLVRIARQYRHLLADAPSATEKMKLGRTALDYGKRAATLAPSDSDAVLSSAITYGKIIKFLSKKEQVAVSKMIKSSAERATKLDPGNDLAWHVLGRWHRNAAEVGGVKRALAGLLYDKLPPASHEDAARCLETAVKLNPNRLIHHVELGRVYAQMGRATEARRHLAKGLSMPSREKDDPDMKQSARETLASLP